MDVFDLSDGKISVSCSSEKLSIGTLELEPGAELDRHNRPVDEQLIQIKGKGGLRIFEEDGETREVIFEEGDSFRIPADKDHQHINPSEQESIVMWKFEGDITEIIEDIRADYERL